MSDVYEQNMYDGDDNNDDDTNEDDEDDGGWIFQWKR